MLLDPSQEALCLQRCRVFQTLALNPLRGFVDHLLGHAFVFNICISERKTTTLGFFFRSCHLWRAKSGRKQFF